MLGADKFPCLEKSKISAVFNLDAANLNQTENLGKFKFINTTIDTSEIDTDHNIKSYNDLLEHFSSLDPNYFSHSGNCSFIYIYSPPGTGKTLLCKKLVSDLLRTNSAEDIHIRMITTTELMSDPKLNLLIEIAYSSNFMVELLKITENDLVKDLREHFPDYMKINRWGTAITKFLKEFEKSRKDPSYLVDLKTKYEELVEEYREFQVQTENFLEYRIKSMLGQRQLDISKNITKGIVDNEIQYAKSKGCKYVVITLDDAVIGTGEQSEFNQKVLSTLTTMAQAPIPEGLEGYVFIFGITFPPPQTLQDRSRALKFDYKWIEQNSLVLSYLKSKLDSILDDQDNCSTCPHFQNKNCSKKISESVLNENFLKKWTDIEFIQSIQKNKKTPRNLSKKFGSMLMNYINGNIIIQPLRKQYGNKDLIPFQVDKKDEERILNFLNLLFWYGEKAGNNEYKIPRTEEWIIKSPEDDLDDYFQKNLIYFKNDDIYTGLNSPAVDFLISDKVVKGQLLEIKPILREDIAQLPDKKISFSYKTQNDNMIEIKPEGEIFKILFNELSSHILRLSVQFEHNGKPIQIQTEKQLNVEDFPIIIEYPQNGVTFFPGSLEKIKVKKLDPTIKAFSIICEMPDGKTKKRGYNFGEKADTKTISWLSHIDNLELKGKYKIYSSIMEKKGFPLEFSIIDSPVLVTYEKDVDTKTVTFTITLPEGLKFKSSKFDDNFEIKWEPKGEN